MGLTAFLNIQKVNSVSLDYNSTPSPSDSAVGDLETVLKEKDNEIVFLR